MKKIVVLLCISVLSFTMLAGCGKKAEPIKASFATVEEQRAQGRSNAALVAAEYQRQNPRVQGWETIVKADSFHNADCPQGDGWAEVVFMRSEREEGKTKNLVIQKATVMCSTVSFSEGCVMVDPTNNWDKHPKKGMDGRCAPISEVPMPLPKVVAQKL